MAIPSGDADCSKSGGVALGSVPWLAFVLVINLTYPLNGFVGTAETKVMNANSLGCLICAV